MATNAMGFSISDVSINFPEDRREEGLVRDCLDPDDIFPDSV